MKNIFSKMNSTVKQMPASLLVPSCAPIGITSAASPHFLPHRKLLNEVATKVGRSYLECLAPHLPYTRKDQYVRNAVHYIFFSSGQKLLIFDLNFFVR